MNDHQLWTKFIDFANPVLEGVISFQLDWWKVKLLPKANWLGEDCLGFARLMMYVFSQFLDEYDLVDKWMETTKEQVYALTELLNWSAVMIYSVMCKDTIHKWKKWKIHIKIFLTCCHHFCKEYYSATAKEFWANKQNFISCLNLSDQIEMFGRVSLGWDGTFNVIIGRAKALLKSSRRNPNSLLPRMVLLHNIYIQLTTPVSRQSGTRSNRVMPDRMIWRSLPSRDNEGQMVISWLITERTRIYRILTRITLPDIMVLKITELKKMCWNDLKKACVHPGSWWNI